MKMIQNDTHPLTTAWAMFKSPDSYGLTYWQFDPYEKDAFKEVTNCLTEYVKRFDGKEIITDFDGLIPRLEAKVALRTNPIKNSLFEFEGIVKDLDPQTGLI